VPKTQVAKLDFYDVWLPNLAPSPELLALAQRSQDERSWKAFERKFRAEMRRPDAARVLDMLAAFSRQTSFSAVFNRIHSFSSVASGLFIGAEPPDSGCRGSSPTRRRPGMGWANRVEPCDRYSP